MRLEHISEKGMQILTKKEVRSASGVLTKKCPHCIAGKEHKTLFKCRPSRKSKPLILVHMDVCSIREKTLKRAQYFITFVDDHFQKVWAYALKTKNQVLEQLKKFHAAM